MLASNQPIQFILHRKGQGPAHDDVMNITQEDTDYYRIRYIDKESAQTSEFHLDEHSMLRYIQTTMDMLCADDDPYEFFQANVPGHPSILLKISQLNNPVIRSNIFSSVKTCLRHWPETKRWRGRVARTQPSTFLAPTPDYSSRPSGAEPSFMSI